MALPQEGSVDVADTEAYWAEQVISMEADIASSLSDVRKRRCAWLLLNGGTIKRC